eukprot:TRINITY_DN1233_c0_g1_i1.p3 TRINITY_DN1233_c0_g1~~TRINITY_DN1233_c0_g1_i1.p3  ORF type:complete len:151 (-),score=0.43 TRINITY_DN1233_c0_g1_i1:610-1062(-)
MISDEIQVATFHAQFQYRAQALFQYHQFCARQSESSFLQSFFDSYLSMISKVEGNFCLTNPQFPIEECLNSLYLSPLHLRVISSFLPEYESVADYCPAPLIPKKSRDSPELTLVLDLDETLVRCSTLPIGKNSVQVPANDDLSDSTVRLA